MFEALAMAAALLGSTVEQRATSADPAGFQIAPLRAQLWYQGSGRLSANIAPPARFALWNTIIGEGDAQENADEMLVSVEIRSRTPQQFINLPLRIEARTADGRVLAQRQVRSLATNEQSRSVQALWVPDVGCAGQVRVTARLGRATRSTTLNFQCGE